MLPQLRSLKSHLSFLMMLWTRCCESVFHYWLSLQKLPSEHSSYSLHLLLWCPEGVLVETKQTQIDKSKAVRPPESLPSYCWKQLLLATTLMTQMYHSFEPNWYWTPVQTKQLNWALLPKHTAELHTWKKKYIQTQKISHKLYKLI